MHHPFLHRFVLSCIRQVLCLTVLHCIRSTSDLSCINSVLDSSCPASVLYSYSIRPILHPPCPASVLSCIWFVLYLICPASVLSCIQPVLYRPACTADLKMNVVIISETFLSLFLAELWSHYSKNFQNVFPLMEIIKWKINLYSLSRISTDIHRIRKNSCSWKECAWVCFANIYRHFICSWTRTWTLNTPSRWGLLYVCIIVYVLAALFKSISVQELTRPWQDCTSLLNS